MAASGFRSSHDGSASAVDRKSEQAARSVVELLILSSGSVSPCLPDRPHAEADYSNHDATNAALGGFVLANQFLDWSSAVCESHWAASF